MSSLTKWGSLVVAVIGVVILVLGIVFIAQAGSAKQRIADDIQPLQISEVEDRYDAVSAQHAGLRQQEEPGIQAGTAMPSATYNYLTIQRTSLGLTRTNIGLVGFMRTTGIINLILGLGLVLAAAVVYKQAKA